MVREAFEERSHDFVRKVVRIELNVNRNASRFGKTLSEVAVDREINVIVETGLEGLEARAFGPRCPGAFFDEDETDSPSRGVVRDEINRRAMGVRFLSH